MVQNQNGYAPAGDFLQWPYGFEDRATVIFGVSDQASKLGQRIHNEKFGIEALAFLSSACCDGGPGNANRLVEVKDS
jgi:hypothetical protein